MKATLPPVPDPASGRVLLAVPARYARALAEMARDRDQTPEEVLESQLRRWLEPGPPWLTGHAAPEG